YRCPTGGTTPEECAESCAAYAIGEMEKHIGPENIACLVVKPIQGEGGFVVTAPGFLPRLSEYCRDKGILFVADEVQTGIGRIGEVMKGRLQDMAERFPLIGEVRGRGAMVAMELVEDRRTKAPAKAAAGRVLEEACRQGVILLKAGTYDNVIRLLPPLTIDED